MIEIEKLQDLVIDENQRLEKLNLFLNQPNYLEILNGKRMPIKDGYLQIGKVRVCLNSLLLGKQSFESY